MIKLQKIEEPSILKENAKKWTEEYLEYIKKGEKIPDNVKKRYSHPEIKAQLIKETNSKCAYCESKLAHISHGDIEHILPKNPDAHPELYVTWENLTLACEKCNRTGKKKYNNDEEPLLNPYTDNIENHIFSAGTLIFSKNADRRGQITIEVLELNRSELLERRAEAIGKINLLRIKYFEEKNEAYKEILLKEINNMLRKEQEYSFILKNFCINAGIDIKAS